MGAGKLGQISMEYLLIVSFAFLLLVPIIIVAYTHSSRFTSDVSAAQIEKVGNEIIDGVNEVYYQGPPTKRTIKLYFPKGIHSVDITNNAILFEVQGSTGTYEYVVTAQTNMSGEIKPFSGTHTVTLTAGETNVTIADT